MEFIKLNKILFLLLIIGIIFCPSCKKNCGETVSIWNKQNKLDYKGFPVSIIWFKESASDLWTPYKGFNKANEIKSIIQLLDKPEINEIQPELKTRNKLSLIYYLGKPESLRIIELYFDINDGLFIGPKGKSPELGKLMITKEESGLERYRFHTPPYDEEFIDRVEKSQELVREQIKKEKEQKHAEENNKTKDHNNTKDAFKMFTQKLLYEFRMGNPDETGLII